MAENFTNFVLKLAQDPQTLTQFQKQPESTMKAANLSPAEQSILLSGNASIIRQAITSDVSVDEDQKKLDGSIWPITVVVAVTVVVAHFSAADVEAPE